MSKCKKNEDEVKTMVENIKSYLKTLSQMSILLTLIILLLIFKKRFFKIDSNLLNVLLFGFLSAGILSFINMINPFIFNNLITGIGIGLGMGYINTV